MQKTRVIVAGAAGRMGRAVMKGVLEDPGCVLVGAVDVDEIDADVGMLVGFEGQGIKIEENLEQLIKEAQPDVLVDFTIAEVSKKNIKTALEANVYPIVGTTGFSDEDMEEIHAICENTSTGAFFAPNFAIGAVLMMECAKKVAKYLPDAEIVELHHDKKIDAPSGTALRTADLISREIQEGKEDESVEKVKGVRGGSYGGTHIHSVRLPGLIAHQEVIFGGKGQTLTIRHDSIDRDSFIPGVILAVKNAPKTKGVVVGLENLMEN